MLRSSIAFILMLSSLAAVATGDELLDRARRARRSGNAAQAMQLYERAVSQSESLEAELGYVSASLEAGQFRNAVSYSNLVAGEHKESAVALALQAYLLDRTGRTERAFEILKQAADNHADESLIAAQADILIDRSASSRALGLIDEWLSKHKPSPGLIRLRHRAEIANAQRIEGSDLIDASAGYPWTPAFARFSIDAHALTRAGNGVVFDKGAHVLTQAALVEGATSIELRNSLGHVRAGRVEKIDAGIATIQVLKPYAPSESLPAGEFAANSDSHFCFVLSYPAANVVDAVYPTVTSGVVIRRNIGVNKFMQITSTLGRDQGSPVFDNMGKLIGLAVRETDELAQFGPGSFVRSLGAREELGKESPTSANAHAPSVEELYERLAPAVVQIVVTN